jgi:uncharacterized protein (DUF697 family)
MAKPTPIPPHLEAAVLHCRRLVRKRALLAAGVAAVPVPGLDWATDIGILLRVIPQINLAFGLTEAQIERLAPERRIAVYKAVSAGGSLLIGKLITRELVIRALQMVGVRLTTQQAAKFVPLAGQAVSALLTYSALKSICDLHIKQCLTVAQQLQLPAPEASPAGS